MRSTCRSRATRPGKAAEYLSMLERVDGGYEHLEARNLRAHLSGMAALRESVIAELVHVGALRDQVGEAGRADAGRCRARSRCRRPRTTAGRPGAGRGALRPIAEILAALDALIGLKTAKAYVPVADEPPDRPAPPAERDMPNPPLRTTWCSPGRPAPARRPSRG